MELSNSKRENACKTCPFISNTVKISGPNRSTKVTDHFTCISVNVINCITCTLCKKIDVDETEKELADRFLEHLRDVRKKKRLRCVQTSYAQFESSESLPPQHEYLRAILIPREHRKPQKSRTKIHLSTWYTLSTRDQGTPLTSLTYSQLHLTIFSPMAKLFYTLI